jgi:GNAT superfamily N-acetyltransferase
MALKLNGDPAFAFPAGVSARILGRADIPVFTEHLLALDMQTRLDRFGGPRNDSWIREYAAHCIRPGSLVIAASAGGPVPVGVAELHPVAHDCGEIAFSVQREWRRQGIGQALFALMVEAAWGRGHDRIEITTNADNEAMRKLAAQFGAKINFDRGHGRGSIALGDIRLFDRDGRRHPLAAKKG